MFRVTAEVLRMVDRVYPVTSQPRSGGSSPLSTIQVSYTGILASELSVGLDEAFDVHTT